MCNVNTFTTSETVPWFKRKKKEEKKEKSLEASREWTVHPSQSFKCFWTGSFVN